MKRQNDIKLYYDNLASEYDDDRFGNTYGKYIDQQEKLIISRLLHNNCISETLDLACGTGRFLEFAKYGSDISSSMLKEAQQKFPDRKLFQYSALNTGFDSEQFSVVLSFHFVMHLDKETTFQFLTEAHRLLKVGGKLIFDFPSAHRREITGYSNNNWHAANAMTVDSIKTLAEGMFSIQKSCGILFFPIHRLPKKIRRFFRWIDLCICHSFFRKYASYIIVVLEKK